MAFVLQFNVYIATCIYRASRNIYNGFEKHGPEKYDSLNHEKFHILSVAWKEYLKMNIKA